MVGSCMEEAEKKEKREMQWKIEVAGWDIR